MIDLNQCKPGDKLRLKNGEIATYSRQVYGSDFPHLIRRKRFGVVSRTSNGFCVSQADPCLGDVVEILGQEGET